VICRLCGQPDLSSFANAQCLGHQINYFDCPCCRYVQTEHPHWLEEAYRSPINASDTGILIRNIANQKNVVAVLSMLAIRRSRVIDYSGGYGLLVRLLRDIGVDAYWKDLYASNLVAVGFEHHGETGNLVTAFEAFEHFVNPLVEVEAMLAIAPNLLFSTELITDPAPPLGRWPYYGLEHGQHIGFFRLETLQYIARRFNKFLVTDGRGLHLLSSSPSSPLRMRIWRVLAHMAPSLLTIGLRSKTWDDHLHLRAGRSR
jgi:hypothetical protein